VKTLFKTVEWFVEQTGKLSAMLVPIIMIILTCEVVLRYVFNRPTIWAMESSQLLMCIFVALGGAYTALQNGHVNVDILVSRLTERKRAIVDVLASPVFFLFVICFMLKMGAIAVASIKVKEHSGTYFNPPLYPVKFLIAIGIFLVFLQGICKLLKDLSKAREEFFHFHKRSEDELKDVE